jgi:hypothetical protein
MRVIYRKFSNLFPTNGPPPPANRAVSPPPQVANWKAASGDDAPSARQVRPGATLPFHTAIIRHTVTYALLLLSFHTAVGRRCTPFLRDLRTTLAAVAAMLRSR